MANTYANKRNNYQRQQNAPAPAAQAPDRRITPKPAPELRFGDLSGVVVPRVYVNEFNDGTLSFSTSISRKNQDGTYDREFISIRCVRDIQEPADAQKGDVYALHIGSGFLSFWRDKKGAARLEIVVMGGDWEVLADGN